MKRKTNKLRKDWNKGIIKNKITVPIKDNMMNDVRPFLSDRNPLTTNPIINPVTVNDNDKPETDVDTPNSSINIGINGCTAYKEAKIKKEAKNKASTILQKWKSLILYFWLCMISRPSFLALFSTSLLIFLFNYVVVRYSIRCVTEDNVSNCLIPSIICCCWALESALVRCMNLLDRKSVV